MVKNLFPRTENQKRRFAEKIIQMLRDEEAFPQTGEEGKKFMEELGFTFDPRVKRVVFHVSTPEEFHISVGPRECVLEVMDAVDRGGLYDLPPGFERFFRKNPQATEMQLAWFRFGDYVLSHCD